MTSAENSLLIINAQLRYYLHIIEPDNLTDEEWAGYTEILNKIRKEEAKR